MNASITRQVRAALGVVLSAAAFTACSSDEQSPLGATRDGGALAVGAVVSNPDAAPGEQVAIAVAAQNTPEQLGVLQGTLKFDRSRLRYVGQTTEGTKVTMVNASRAEAGELRFLTYSAGGINDQSGTFVFEVLAPVYARTLSVDLELASDKAGKREIRAARSADVLTQPLLAVPAAARRMSLADWNNALYPDLVEAEARLPKAKLVSIANERYGNINLSTETGACGVDVPGSSSVNGLDALFIANISVGNNSATDTTASGGVSPNGRDPMVAGNVAPAPSAARPQVGINANGTRSIDGLDALAVSQENVGINHPVVCTLVNFAGPTGSPTTVLGNITTNTTWTTGQIIRLDGIVRVNNGATLTIQPGVRVEGLQTSTTGTTSALFIERDGRIDAQGTPQQPIVFTCDQALKSKGCWGGVVIAGNGSINGGQGAAANTQSDSPAIVGRVTSGGPNGDGTNCLAQNYEGSEASPATLIRFGGCNPADSSGVIRFARFEYGGFQFQPNKELNNLTVGGVGSKTVIEYIQVHAGLDDGMEIFGGELSPRFLVITANSDDGFDYSQGWSGNAQFLIVQQDTADADKAFEIDNTESPQSLSLAPLTTGGVANATLIGKLAFGSNTGPNTANDVEGGIVHRRGASPTRFTNFILMGFPAVMDLDDVDAAGNPSCGADVTTVTQWNGQLSLDVTRIDNSDNEVNCPPFTTGVGASMEDDWYTSIASNVLGTNGTATTILLDPYNRVNPNFDPVSSAAVSGGVSPGAPFVSTTYKGAVDPAGAAIPWYLPWSRGWTTSTQP